jgi:hypothetical protein
VTAPDPLDVCRTMLGASTHVDVDIATIYTARARLALEEAREALRVLELGVVAREREIARLGAPKTQLEIGGADAKR